MTPLVPRSLPALAFLAARLADERYAATWQFRQYGYWIGRIQAVRDMARADAMEELWSIYVYLGGNSERRTTTYRNAAQDDRPHSETGQYITIEPCVEKAPHHPKSRR